jgi:hypothetical protein
LPTIPALALEFPYEKKNADPKIPDNNHIGLANYPGAGIGFFRGLSYRQKRKG